MAPSGFFFALEAQKVAQDVVRLGLPSGVLLAQGSERQLSCACFGYALGVAFRRGEIFAPSPVEAVVEAVVDLHDLREK